MKPYRFDPVDIEQMRLLGQLPPGRRIQVMLDAQELAVGKQKQGGKALLEPSIVPAYPNNTTALTEVGVFVGPFSL